MDFQLKGFHTGVTHHTSCSTPPPLLFPLVASSFTLFYSYLYFCGRGATLLEPQSYNMKSLNCLHQRVQVCLMQDYSKIRGLAASPHPSPPPPPPAAGSSIRPNALLIFPQELPWAKRQLCSSVA